MYPIVECMLHLSHEAVFKFGKAGLELFGTVWNSLLQRGPYSRGAKLKKMRY